MNLCSMHSYAWWRIHVAADGCMACPEGRLGSISDCRGSTQGCHQAGSALACDAESKYFPCAKPCPQFLGGSFTVSQVNMWLALQDALKTPVTAEVLHKAAIKLDLRLSLPEPGRHGSSHIFAPATPEPKSSLRPAEPQLVDIAPDIASLEVSSEASPAS